MRDDDALPDLTPGDEALWVARIAVYEHDARLDAASEKKRMLTDRKIDFGDVADRDEKAARFDSIATQSARSAKDGLDAMRASGGPIDALRQHLLGVHRMAWASRDMAGKGHDPRVPAAAAAHAAIESAASALDAVHAAMRPVFDALPPDGDATGSSSPPPSSESRSAPSPRRAPRRKGDAR